MLPALTSLLVAQVTSDCHVTYNSAGPIHSALPPRPSLRLAIDSTLGRSTAGRREDASVRRQRFALFQQILNNLQCMNRTQDHSMAYEEKPARTLCIAQLCSYVICSIIPPQSAVQCYCVTYVISSPPQDIVCTIASGDPRPPHK